MLFRSIWSPQSPAATDSAAADAEDGETDSGERDTFHHAKVSENGEEEAAELAVARDLSREERIGGGERRRR